VSTPARLRVEPNDPDHPEAVALIRALSSELAAMYDHADDGSGAFAPDDARGPRARFVVARLDGHPVGCGAIRPLDAPDDPTAEIKRMYVAPEARGKGVGRAVLGALLALARELGYRRAILETGNRNLDAMALYERAGFARVPCYGRYVDDPRSRCYALEL
jgi:putative acetyltransferase